MAYYQRLTLQLATGTHGTPSITPNPQPKPTPPDGPDRPWIGLTSASITIPKTGRWFRSAQKPAASASGRRAYRPYGSARRDLVDRDVTAVIRKRMGSGQDPMG